MIRKMQLYVLQGGKPTGPFEEAELISRWKKGTVRDTESSVSLDDQ
jgi:hypothetical protein